MSLGENRGSLIRVSIYVLALIMVLILLLHRRALIPTHGVWVNQVRETGQIGPLVAGAGEKLLLVEVKLAAPIEVLDRLSSGQFTLVDSLGGEHRPDSLSPLFTEKHPLDGDQAMEGTLVFRLPPGTMGKSLSFQPEVAEHASDYESKDFGQEGRP
jgi:hypothetical protein